MGLTEREREWGARASRFLKAELKRADIGYKELAERLNRHGLAETETSITWQASARYVRRLILSGASNSIGARRLSAR